MFTGLVAAFLFFNCQRWDFNTILSLLQQVYQLFINSSHLLYTFVKFFPQSILFSRKISPFFFEFSSFFCHLCKNAPRHTAAGRPKSKKYTVSAILPCSFVRYCPSHRSLYPHFRHPCYRLYVFPYVRHSGLFRQGHLLLRL